MSFEVFKKRLSPLAKAPSLTIQKRGLISMSRSAYALLGEPPAVELLYDRERKVVGLRACEERVAHAYEVRIQNPEKETGQALVAGTAFTTYYGIDTSISRRYEPWMEEGILCVDVGAGGVEVVGNRGKRPTMSDERA